MPHLVQIVYSHFQRNNKLHELLFTHFLTSFILSYDDCLFILGLASFVSVSVHALHVMDITEEVVDESFGFLSAFNMCVETLWNTASFTDTLTEVLQAFSFSHEVISFSCAIHERNEALSDGR